MKIPMLRTKLKRHDCSCRRSTPGNPKYGHGPCYLDGNPRRAVRERIEGKKIVREELVNHEDGGSNGRPDG